MRLLVTILFFIPFVLCAQNKVGINTEEPRSDLDIRGTDDATDGGELQLATPSESNFLRLFGGRLGDRHPFMAFHDQDTFHFVTTLPDWSTYTRRLSILPTGNVGIGTSNPLAKLDIAATGDGAEVLRFSTDRPWVFRQRDSGIFTKLTLQSTIDDKAFEILSQDSTNRAAVFFSNNVHSNVLLVPDGGEAGAGVEDPLAKFHIKHNSNTGWPQLRLTEDENDFARIKMETTTDPGIFWDIAGRADSIPENSRINFYYANPGFTGDKMTIMGNGNVGIGRTSPEAKLDILGGDWNLGAGNPGDLRIGNSAANAFRIGVATGGGGAGTTRMYSQGGDLLLGTNNSSQMTISTSGNVGIGTTIPASKLTVVGPESNGTKGPLEIKVVGTPPFYFDEQSMILDGNEIDVIGTVINSLVLQGNSNGMIRMVEGGGGVGIGQNGSSIRRLSITGQSIPIQEDLANSPATVSIFNNENSFSEMLLDGNEIQTVDEALNINTKSQHDIILSSPSGGGVGIGVTPASKLTVLGPDNNGNLAGLEIRSYGNSDKMLLDGNEIDVTGSATALHLNTNTGHPVTIGSTAIASGYKLCVDGKIIAEEVRVQLSGAWPDYVFTDDYDLLSLEALKQEIHATGHLPGIPSANEIEAQGLQLGDMQKRMMEKIEELTLHMIALNERISILETENAALRGGQNK